MFSPIASSGGSSRHSRDSGNPGAGVSMVALDPRFRGGDGRRQPNACHVSALHDGLAADVFAAAEHQRRLVGIGEALDVADEDDVVAAVMAKLAAAFEM